MTRTSRRFLTVALDELLLEFAQSLLFADTDELVLEPQGTGLESVRRLLDLIVLGEPADGHRPAEYASETIHRVVLELRTQAVHDPTYRECFETFDGTIYLCLEGALLFRSTTDDDQWLVGVREQLGGYLEGIVRDDVTFGE